jgi:hypothetical protein
MAWNGNLEEWGRNAWGLEGVEENYFNLTIPKRRVSFVTEASSGVFNLKKPSIFLNFNSGSVFNLVIPHRVFALTDASNGVFNITIPKHVFSLVESGIRSGVFNLTVPKRKFKLIEGTISSGVFNLTIPHRLFEFTGKSSTSGLFTLHVPKRRFSLREYIVSTTSTTVTGQTSTVLGLVVNTDTGVGPTIYINWDWDSVIQIGDSVYVADSTGLYEVIGELDKGVTPINSYITIPESDFGVSDMKTMTDAFVGMKGGPLSLQTFHDDSYSSAHTLNTTANEIVTKRVKLGIGLRQRYWGVKVASINGAAWKLDSVELDGVVHSRKINQK